jgi:mycothiol synthase
VSSGHDPDLPAGYRRRPLSLDDIDAVASVWRRCDAALGVHPESPESFLDWVLRLPHVVHDRDTLLSERGGDAVAFAIVQRDPASEGSSLTWFADVDPGHQGRALGPWIVRWALGIVDRRMTEEGPFEVLTMASAPNVAARRLFDRFGFRHVRTMWDMHRAVRADDEPVPSPDGITIRRFETGRDERTFWRVAEGAFVEHFNHTPTPYVSWEAEWYRSEDWHPERILLADRDGAVVGETAWVDADPDGYIVSVGVLPEHRGRGIARALLRRAFADIATAGFPNATLTVDSENTTGAVELYRSVGMEPIRETHVFRFEERSGRE